MSFIGREKKSLLILFGPVSLVISLFLLIKPDFDEYEIPKNEKKLIKIEGVVNRNEIKSKHNNHYIYVNSGSIEYQIKVKCRCSNELIGTNVSILASHDTMGRSFYDAWELISNGNSIYSLNEVVNRRRAGYAKRSTYAWWGLFIGILFTPIWYRSTKKDRATTSN